MNRHSLSNGIFALLLSLAIGSTQAQPTVQAPSDWTTKGPDLSVRLDSEWARPSGAGKWDGSTSWIAPDGKGKVVVLVRTAPYFRMFTREGVPVRNFGAPGLFDTAHSLSFDPDGNLWVTDSTWHVVSKFSPDGELLMTLGVKGEAGDNASTTHFNQPNHVGFAANGDIYVSDGYVNARIVHFAKDGEFVRIIGGVQGSEPGQLQVPHGVVIDSRGRILVNDSDNARISVFNADGSFAETWPFPSRGGIVIAPDDTVFVSDVNAGIVNVLRDGKMLNFIRVPRAHGLGVDTDGSIYVSGASAMTAYKVTRGAGLSALRQAAPP